MVLWALPGAIFDLRLVASNTYSIRIWKSKQTKCQCRHIPHFIPFQFQLFVKYVYWILYHLFANWNVRIDLISRDEKKISPRVLFRLSVFRHPTHVQNGNFRQFDIDIGNCVITRPSSNRIKTTRVKFEYNWLIESITMSIPQIFLTSAGTSIPINTLINSRSTQPANQSSKEHIRERLNMHVKKRIQGQDILTQFPPLLSPGTTTFPHTALPSALRPPHQFLMTGSFHSSSVTTTHDWKEPDHLIKMNMKIELVCVRFLFYFDWAYQQRSMSTSVNNRIEFWSFQPKPTKPASLATQQRFQQSDVIAINLSNIRFLTQIIFSLATHSFKLKK